MFLKIPKDDRWLCWILDLVYKRADVSAATLEALQDVPFVLDTGMATDALCNH